ncbi:hypothetical protein PCANC_07842 [Puccinia coronata f. sp. avenae]|uniref:Uncharacterized protein n=1 Tax=Puccinia coronata f. sp. avenae TaxID=200324 RepID=A0A2N5VBZ1_9BASI|nr:hypothetical protein PCANC_07842 [Puccinia coronata f. sp. avenae]
MSSDMGSNNLFNPMSDKLIEPGCPTQDRTQSSDPMLDKPIKPGLAHRPFSGFKLNPTEVQTIAKQANFFQDDLHTIISHNSFLFPTSALPQSWYGPSLDPVEQTGTTVTRHLPKNVLNIRVLFLSDSWYLQSFPGTSADLPFSKNRIKSGVRIKSALWPASIYGILQKSLQACLAQLFIIPLVVHFSITVLVISRVRNSIGQAIDQAG